MKAFIALSCLVVVASARPGVLLNAPLAWNGVSAYSAGTPLSSQYHAQDELGQYSYGYAAGPSSKAETKTADGITRGSFSYVDSHGLLQSRSYVADALGFRVAASDLPVGPAPVAAAAPVAVAAPVVAGPVHVAALPAPVADTYEVAAAKAQHYAAHAEARARNGDGLLLAGAPIAAPVAVAAPIALAAPAAPVVAAAGLQSQYHAQDELGQYSYGYAGGLSAKNEAKTADGITRGSYSYVDAHGLVQSRSYVSDPINGFRVAASDLPVGPAPVAAAAPVAIAAPVAAAPIAVAAPIAPAPIAAAPIAAAPIAAAPAAILSDDTVLVGGVADTPEVAAAKAAHFAAHHEAHARLANAY